MSVAVLAVLGGLGALARYEVGGWVQGRGAGTDGRATLIVNVTGSLALGFVSGPFPAGPAGSDMAVAVIGFLGGFTTFSAASVEAARMLLERRWAAGLAYGLGTWAVALVATVLGLAAAAALVPA